MEILIKAGFAAPFFISDADRAISLMTEPAVMASLDEMTLELLACGIGELALSQKKGKVQQDGRSPQFIGLDAAREALNQIIDKGAPTEPLVLPRPLLILTQRLDKAAMAPLLILKMRGFVQTLAIRFKSSSEIVEVLDVLSTCAKPRPNSGAVVVFDGIQKLCVVSGLDATALSTESSCDGILKKYPEIARDKPLSDAEYLFDE